ncbi:MAG TPA: nitroreductase family protein [Rubrobacter sp.]|nr:nitroreductase family protein [Rubrobacter sp.]
MSETPDARTTNDRITFLRTLRAVRAFRPDPVPQGVLDDILEVARWSGSASNSQPWEMIVVQNRDTLGALALVDGYAGHLARAPLGIVLVMAGEREAQEGYDEGRLAERIMLAAHAYGVGSSIGWIVGRGRDAARALLGIPGHRMVRTAISLGYPDGQASASRPGRGRARKPLDEIVHQEGYGSEDHG